jgi:hypothetical protein
MKEAPSFITDGSTNKMAMAKQSLAALEGNKDLKAMLKLALKSADWRQWLVLWKPQFVNGVNWGC